MERYLTTVTSTHEGDLIESLLEQSGISVLRKSRQSDSYMKIMGFPGICEEIFVSAADLDRANDILAANLAIETSRDSCSAAIGKRIRIFYFVRMLILGIIRLWMLIVFAFLVYMLVTAL